MVRPFVIAAATLCAAAAAVSAPARRAAASAPRYSDIMPESQVHAGMTGYGLTVFRGTRIDRFAVKVVGVVKKGSLIVPGHDMILVRMYGGPMTSRKANLIKGMSGSPVYIGGKIIGAFSQGEPTTTEPLGGVTPIEDMLDAWDPRLPDKPLMSRVDNGIHVASLRQPIRLGDRTITRVVYNVPQSSLLRSHGGTLVLHPCTTFATTNLASRTAFERLAKLLAAYNVELVQGAVGARNPDFKGAPLVPGAAFSMMLMTGDQSMGATGTVSYRRGDRILGFGHPFLDIGPISAPLASAYIYDVYPLLAGSYKIASPGPVVGTSTQDRDFSISGVIGKTARTIPITVDVHDVTTGRGRVFHSQVASHPNLYAGLVSAAVDASVAEIHNTPGPAMARVTTTVDAEEIGKVSRSNLVFDARAIDAAATGDLDDLLSILTANPFYPLGIRSAYVKVDIESGHRTAQVERVFLKEGRFEPGQTADVGVVIKPYKQPAVIRTVPVKIPASTPSGRYVLIVRGGAVPAAINLGGMVLRPSSGGNAEQAPPASVRQMVTRYDEREKNNDIVARLMLPTTAVNVEGQRLSNLPPSLDALMRSAKSSGVRLERDEVKVVTPTDWVVSGAQALTINVQKREMQESPTSSPGSTTPSFGSGLPSGGATGQAFDEPTPPSDNADGAADTSTSASERAFAATPPRRAQGGAARGDRSGSTPPALASPSQAQSPPAASPSQAQPAPVSEAGRTDRADKPVGRQPVVWRQTTRSDFTKGEARGASVTTGGDLRLTRTLTRLETSTDSFVWSLIADGHGGLYAGTGTSGRILHVAPDGASRTFATVPELSVHSLYLSREGTLWAGTGPNGRIYRIGSDGKPVVAYQAPEKYVLALAPAADGGVYAGTGGGDGTVYQIGPSGIVRTFFRTHEEHVLSLAIDRSNNLLVGTGTQGIVYRVTPQGVPTVLYDAPESSITGLAVATDGSVYAATAPKGVIYRIASDGSAKSIYDKAPAAFTAACAGPDGVAYAAGGNTVYSIHPDGTVAPFSNQNDVDILALAVGAAGTVYAGTGNVAEIYQAAQRGATASGEYTSVVHDARLPSRWGSIRWTGVVPSGTRLSVETRTGDVAEPDSTWSAWTAPRTIPDGGRILSPGARYIQYRVRLESDAAGKSPSLRDVAVTYLPRNQAPRVAFSSPAGGERWSGQQSVRWEASDPDKDTLSYELYYSADSGTHWQPLPAGSTAGQSDAPGAPAGVAPAPVFFQPADSGGKPTATVDGPPGSGPPSVAAVTAELDKHPGLPTALRDAILARAREVSADVDARRGVPASAAGSAARSAPLHTTSRQVDTRTLPDGPYLLKVVATDRPSNPSDAQEGETVSEPFIICNSRPSVTLLASSVRVGADRSVLFQGVATQKTVSVVAVQFRVDGGDWVAAAPSDGLFDSSAEGFTVATQPLTPGSHAIEVKAYNSAGLNAVEKLTVEVK